jgi:hypothetical protein
MTEESEQSLILQLFSDDIEGLTPDNSGNYRIDCPDGKHDRALVIFPDTNCLYCHAHQTKFGLLEAAGLKYGFINCSEGRQEKRDKVINKDLYTQIIHVIKHDFSPDYVEKFLDKISPITPLKKINVVPLKRIKTRVLVADITPGINILKGYIASCPICAREKIVFTKTLKHCSTLFAEQHSKENTKPCYGDKGGLVELNFDSINDTGYFCTAYDPLDNSTTPQFTSVFFSNKIIPDNIIERQNFEVDIQTKHLIIEGEIKVLPSTKKMTEWFIDVNKYYFENIEISINYDLFNKFNIKNEKGESKPTPRDDSFFVNHFTPKQYSKLLQKKITAIDLISPYKIILPNGAEEYGVLNIIEVGDPGQNKTIGQKEVLKYCRNTQSKFLSTENATIRGLIGAAVKNPNTGQWMVKTGEIPLAHKCKVVLDGYGKLNEYDFTQLRGIQEEHEYQIIKAGHVVRHCAIRLTCLGNLIHPVENYPTKHKASFDLASTTFDREHKFSGADRRRYHHITVTGNNDTFARDIDTHLFFNYTPEAEEGLIEYWDNLRCFAWNLKPNEFIWEDDIITKSKEKIELLRERYSSFTLDYGILSKAGMKMFMVQLPAVAILHTSINEDHKVVIKSEHVEWLYNVYVEELSDLGLEQENFEKAFYETHAKLILESEECDNKHVEILAWVHKYGNQTAVENSGKISRMGIWKQFRKVIPYKYKDPETEEEKECFYSFLYGSGDAELKEKKDQYGEVIKEWYEFTEPDGEIPQICKKNGTITQFGQIICKLAFQKKFTLLTLTTPSSIPIYNNNTNNNKIIITLNNNVNSVSSVNFIDDKIKKSKKPQCKPKHQKKDKTDREQQFYEHSLSKPLLQPICSKEQVFNELLKSSHKGLTITEVYDILGDGSPKLLQGFVDSGEAIVKDGVYYTK